MGESSRVSLHHVVLSYDAGRSLYDVIHRQYSAHYLCLRVPDAKTHPHKRMRRVAHALFYRRLLRDGNR